MMEFRNPVRLADGRINCEVLNDQLGWLPFTASPDDPSEAGRALYDEIAAGEVPDAPIGVADMDSVRSNALSAMADWISGFTARFTAGYPPEEVAAWPVKAAAARAHLTGITSPLIEAEAALTGEDVDDLAALIAGMADQYEAVIARVTGLRRATRDAIMAAETPEAVTAVLTAAKAQAEAMIEELALPYA
jgi:hypothetical protein